MSQTSNALALVRAQKQRLDKIEEILSFINSCEPNELALIQSGVEEKVLSNKPVEAKTSLVEQLSSTVRKTNIGLEGAMESAVEDMNRITTPEVVRCLIEQGFEFGSTNPLAAVNQVFRKWKLNGFLIEIERGAGRRASVYKKAQKKQDERSLAS